MLIVRSYFLTRMESYSLLFFSSSFTFFFGFPLLGPFFMMICGEVFYFLCAIPPWCRHQSLTTIMCRDSWDSHRGNDGRISYPVTSPSAAQHDSSIHTARLCRV